MTTKTPKASISPATETRAARPGQPASPRVVRPGRRTPPRRQTNFLTAWGPLIVVVVVALSAVVALALNPFVVQDKLVKPTPVSLEGLGEVIPAVPPTAAARQQTPVPGAQATVPAVAAVPGGPTPTKVPFLAQAGTQQGNVAGFPERLTLPMGNTFPFLGFPDTSPQLSSNPEALAIMNQSRSAINALSTMRERLYGEYRDPATTEQVGVEDYTILYRKPGTRYRTGTYTIRFEAGFSQTRPEFLESGTDYYKPEAGDTWSKAQSRNAFAWPGPSSVFGNAFNANIVGDDTIDGRAYKVIEYDQLGNDDNGAPGFRYRNRIWIDASTNLPLKMEKNSIINPSPRGGEKQTTRQFFQQVSLFDSFDAPLEIPNPTTIVSPALPPQATPTPK